MMLPTVPSSGGPSGLPTTSGDIATAPWRPVVAENVSHNLRQIHLNRHMTALTAGAVAGICGLENLAGFGVYMLLTVMGSLVFLLEAKMRLNAFFLKPTEPFTGSLFSGLMTFVLSWTLVYNAVYVF
ncbi:rab5-interacting protein [Cyclospora cayetanensis]|uniref:ER membrane protein complex subunit 6 n=1 Tax=Cyclospora cayetanensis TaxID=88456 RepID=A0A1D3D4I2_9EIME|nr:rab5-interacting protein [Cyclospora cayetanensis]